MQITIVGAPKEGKTTVACLISKALASVGIEAEIYDHPIYSGAKLEGDTIRRRQYQAHECTRKIKSPVIIVTKQLSKTAMLKEKRKANE